MRRVLQQQTRSKRINLKNLQNNLTRIWRRRSRYATRVRLLRNLNTGQLITEFLQQKNLWTVKRMEASIRGFFRGFRR